MVGSGKIWKMCSSYKMKQRASLVIFMLRHPIWGQVGAEAKERMKYGLPVVPAGSRCVSTQSVRAGRKEGQGS